VPDSSGGEVTGVFERDGGCYLPTEAARGPWNPAALHGAAVAALLAGVFEAENQVIVRVLVELLGPVPHRPLTIEVGASEGGRRVKRQSAVLYADDRAVATASATRVRLADLDLSAKATAHPVIFDPARVPPLDQPSRHAVGVVGWPTFDSLAMASVLDPDSGSGSVKLWLRLVVPLVAGQATTGTQRAVAAADYASGGTSARLSFKRWSYMNADLTVGLSRPPQGEWIGMDGDGIVSPTGTGISVASLHDRAGRLGQSIQSLLVEAKSSPAGR
jgi:hypothetical protein